MQFRFHTTTAALACCAAMAIAGCDSQSTAPTNLVNVLGNVALDGKPLAACNVSFIPRDRTKGHGGFAVTDAEGKFAARHWSNASGIEPGTYTVVFSKLALPDGSPIPQGKNAADVGAVETLPRKLTDPARVSNANVITVQSDGSEFRFALKSR